MARKLWIEKRLDINQMDGSNAERKVQVSDNGHPSSDKRALATADEAGSRILFAIRPTPRCAEP
jgi:hypothetical protein